MKLIQGDCLEALSTIADQSIDAIICDPPYGVTRCGWDNMIDFELLWTQLKRIITPTGAIVLFGSQPFTSKLIISNLEMFKYCVVWEKSRGSNFVHANYQPLKVHEDIVIFSFGGVAQGSLTQSTYNMQLSPGKPYTRTCRKTNAILDGGGRVYDLNNKTGERSPRSVIYFSSDSDGDERGLHPTQKPVALMEYLVKTYSNKADTVLDFTMGCGSTGIACAKNSREFIGIELNKEYFDIAESRILKTEQQNDQILNSFKF